MELPRIKTRVVHSESNNAWNIVGTNLGDKYKIARVPYFVSGVNDNLDQRNKQEAYEHAMFISTCFNVAFEDNRTKIKVGLDHIDKVLENGLSSKELVTIIAPTKQGKTFKY